MPIFQSLARGLRRSLARTPTRQAYEPAATSPAGAAPPTLGARPDRHAYQDILVGNWTDWDVYAVRAALDQHERGIFYDSALLADYMLRDDRVASALQTRVLGVAGLPFKLNPGANAADAARATSVVADLQKVWPRMFPEEVLAQMMRWASVEGFALAEVVWDTDGGSWIPGLKVWHPQHVYYRLDTRRYVALTMEGPIDVDPGDGKWLLYAPGGAYRGWMSGVVRSLAIPFLLRQYALRDWARYSEVHGLPIRGAVVPTGASDREKTLFFNQVASLGNESTLLLPRDMVTGKGFDLELKEANEGQSWQAFEKLVFRCDASIMLAILGQNLAGGEVKGGSFAAAKVADGVRDDYKRADVATLTTTLVGQLLEPWAHYNYGDRALAPVPCWEAAPPEDKAGAASTFKTVMEAATLAAELGAEVDTTAMVERFTLPLKPGALRAPAPATPGAPSAIHRLDRRSAHAAVLAGQVYVDGAADRARRAGATALGRGVLETVRATIAASHSYEDLRAKLLVAFRDVDAREFEQVVRGATELALATGVWSAGQETG